MKQIFILTPKYSAPLHRIYVPLLISISSFIRKEYQLKKDSPDGSS